MKIVDAGVVVELFAGNLAPERLGDEELAAPHLIDSEVTHVLRGLVRRGVLSDPQGDLALQGFTQLALARFPADWLRPRMWALRHNLSAYDATYVALTELTEATALMTTDARLAHAPGADCHIELLC
ncbi:VapC toxin family PIN domain ribonuclease [Allosaccharopolyspora coralli]|uniref:Ribonuclease VapC n=1 Tax=Allosaccharopolyspora coralli TaxID=2665642 RepID=A0A5Q3QH55_9PSEU|nr:type II toxin-antitoxin system VapC family toxin [Allosaccharopolyspora coralli]QGK70855.1 VapC toxin family PIN domain ribonuclease [Allosaccharopolyspora coralli]